jgi:DNA polymerase-3 subunit epsilon
MYFVPWHNGFNPRQDGDALAINRYFERGVYKEMATQSATSEFYELLHELLLGNTIAGSNPRFDANILANQFLKMGLQPEPWHHRLLDLSTYAAGALGLPMDELPGLQKVCDILEVPFPDEHSAMGDVLATRNCLHRLDMTLRAQKTFAGIEPGPLG